MGIIKELDNKLSFKTKYLSCDESNCIKMDMNEKDIKEEKFVEMIKFLSSYVQTSKISGSKTRNETLQEMINNFAFNENKTLYSDKSLIELAAYVKAKVENRNYEASNTEKDSSPEPENEKPEDDADVNENLEEEIQREKQGGAPSFNDETELNTNINE